MRLKSKPAHTKQPLTEKIKLEGNTANQVSAYIEYYQEMYDDQIDCSNLLIEMITAFISYDRNFRKWYQKRNAKVKVASNKTNWL